jgi:hypothetical protein
MGLPTEEILKQLGALVVGEGKKSNGKWYTYKGVMDSLDRMKGDIAVTAAGSGAQSAVTGVAAVGGVHSGLVAASAMGIAMVTFMPIGAALAPWIAAATVAAQNNDINELIGLEESYAYSCKCGGCRKRIKYVYEKKQINIAKKVAGVFTAGVATLVTTAYSVYKHYYGAHEKDEAAKGLVESARTGCTIAMAAIFLICGNWSSVRGGDVGTMKRACAVMTSEDGWLVLKNEI